MVVPKAWMMKCSLSRAIHNNDVEAVKQLLSNGVDVDTMIYAKRINMPLISFCAEQGKFEIAKLLLDRGCSLSLRNTNGEFPLHVAVLYRHKDIVELLLQHRADVSALDNSKRTALHVACMTHQLDVVKMLVNKGGNLVNARDYYGQTPLSTSCIHTDLEIMSFLLDSGAVMSITDLHGNTPLLLVLENPNCSFEVVSLLLQNGEQVNYKNKDNDTAILRACYLSSFGHEEKSLGIIDLLIQNGCDLDVCNRMGHTPIHIAVQSNSKTIVHKLLNSGCDINVADGLGNYPVFYALCGVDSCSKSSNEIFNLMLEAGADIRKQDWSSYSHKLDKLLTIKSQSVPKLKNLCRVKLRSSLGRHLEIAVPKLNLPRTIVSYLLLK